MKIQFMGAARTVTGSCYVIDTGNTRFAVDCGMHQGNAEIDKRNYASREYRPHELDFILLTHAHIDHSGLVPRMTKEGFTGPVYCTEPTLDLLDIMLRDSAHIQETEAEWTSRKRARSGQPPVPALYTEEDAATAIGLLRPISYNTYFEPAQGVKVCYRDAGHILGSAFLEMEVSEQEGPVRMLFSGDLGRGDALIVNDPFKPEGNFDCLFMESTYGNRDHKNEDTSRDELAEAIRYSYSNGEKTIIPAFAVERTQEILYVLHMLHKEGRLPADLPVYVDSPLAIKATEIFRRHTDFFDTAARAISDAGDDPFSVPGLAYTPKTDDSKAINEQKGPAIVISASGMCNAGRIKHHLRHNLWRKGASIVFVGFQAVGTPGRRLVDGAKSISILGEDISVEAKIFTIGGFSGHAGQSQLLEWLGGFYHKGMKVVLVHGEEKAQQTLAELIRERYELEVELPQYLQTLELLPGKAPFMEKSAPAVGDWVNWDKVFSLTEDTARQLQAAAKAAAKLPWAEQLELLERISDINERVQRLARTQNLPGSRAS